MIYGDTIGYDARIDDHDATERDNQIHIRMYDIEKRILQLENLHLTEYSGVL